VPECKAIATPKHHAEGEHGVWLSSKAQT